MQATSTRKSYAQICPVATGLDFIGDRWTILILRELLGGPARFQDLKDGLPGIPSNLLAERLRRMESDGIAERSGASGLYSLTDTGEAIRTAIEELGMWGARIARSTGPVAEPVHGRSTRASAMALHSILVRTPNLPSTTVELVVDDDPIEVILGPSPRATARPAIRPDGRLITSSAGLAEVLAGTQSLAETILSRDGDEQATAALIDAIDP